MEYFFSINYYKIFNPVLRIIFVQHWIIQPLEEEPLTCKVLAELITTQVPKAIQKTDGPGISELCQDLWDTF